MTHPRLVWAIPDGTPITDQPSSCFGDPGHAASLLLVVELLDHEDEAAPADDANLISFVCARVAPRLPDLAGETNLSQRSARLCDGRNGADQRLRSHLDTPAAGDANPERGFGELENCRDGHEHDSPRAWNEEEGGDDGGDQEHVARSRGSARVTQG
jgi:hypothetical protein